MKKPTFKMIAALQVLVVISVFTSWWLFRTSVYLKTPIGPYGEYYAHNWGFQGMVGALYLIGLLVLTTFVIILERWIYGFFYDEGPWLPRIGPESDGGHHGGGFGDDTNHSGHGDSGSAGD
jgi:hypothetical protein